jgi:DNA-binding CsgD family transcriptional regulator
MARPLRHFAEALPILEQATANDSPGVTPAEIYESASAYFGLGIAYSALGEPGRAQRRYAMARAHFRSLGIAHLVRVTLSWELETVYVDYHADRPAERRALLREYAESQQGADFQTTMATGATLLDGNWDAIRSGIDGQRHVDALRIYFARLLAELDRLQGNYAQAWSHIASAVPDGPDARPDTYQFHNILNILGVAAALALDQEDFEIGGRWIRALERWLHWSGKLSGRPAPHLLWSRYYLPSGDLDAAGEHARAAYELAVSPRQALALLASQRALGVVDTLAGRHDDARRRLNEARELAAACAAPYERALTLLAQARLELASGREDATHLALDEVESICTPLGAQPALAEVAVIRGHLTARQLDAGLSVRELDVLRLVSEGLTDREVAERLYVSPRTVNQHLRSIYNKLGVNSRTAATRQAIERGIV